MHDDGIVLVALDHAHVEEPGVLAVHRVMHDAAVAVAMVLRRLHEPHRRIGESRDQVPEPPRIDHVIRVDHGDDFRLRRRVGERQPQRAGLESRQLVDAHELEAIAKPRAMLFHRAPHGRVGRIVDDQDALEIGVIEPRHGIEGELEHLGRLPAGRDVHRHLGYEAFGSRQLPGEEASRLVPESDRRDLLDARERDRHQRHQQSNAEQ